MMRALFFVSAGVLLVFGETLAGLPVLVSALLSVFLGVVGALGASERKSALSVAFGALGVLAGGTVMHGSPALGGAVLLLGLYLERAQRARTQRGKGAHVALVLAIGATCGLIGSHFGTSDLPTRIVAAVVAATLAGMPLFLSVRDRIGESLARGKARLAPPLSARVGKLLDIYELGGEIELEREVARASAGAFTSLADLVDQRLDLEDALKGRAKQLSAMTKMIDRNIERHAELLERAHAAMESDGPVSPKTSPPQTSEVAPSGAAVDAPTVDGSAPGGTVEAPTAI